MGMRRYRVRVFRPVEQVDMIPPPGEQSGIGVFTSLSPELSDIRYTGLLEHQIGNET